MPERNAIVPVAVEDRDDGFEQLGDLPHWFGAAFLSG